MRRLPAAALAALLLGLAAAPAAEARTVRIGEFRLSEAKVDRIRDRWVDRLLERYEPGTWAPAKVELSDADLRDMGLPPRRKLVGKRFPVPTAVHPDGRMVPLGTPQKGRDKPQRGGDSEDTGSAGGSGGLNASVATFAGTGFFGIRPGAWVLLLDGGGISWCSLAHVFGTPGDYEISTAGHCGKVGETATVIGVVGNRTPVLLDFGTFSRSSDGGLGNDWALIDIKPELQHLVTPTMAFWGGPKGMFTKTGDVARVELPRRGLVPSIAVNPDPFLAQQILHYGHGLGVGAGGTPRSGTAISWRSSHFMFSGAISPGDSGSGSNTLTGDSIGAQREAAGINTHLWVDPRLRSGLGIFGGTRTTQVPATLVDGQLVPYPAPLPGAP